MTIPAKPARSRILIDVLEREFSRLHDRAHHLISQTPDEALYLNPANAARHPSVGDTNSSSSIGENALRSAAAVEQTSGGLNSNLWDDPFEWTLPEQLSTAQLLIEYLDEVEATRRHCFARFRDDADLFKEVALPSEQIEPLISVLMETLVRAAALQGRALAAAKIFSDVRGREVII